MSDPEHARVEAFLARHEGGPRPFIDASMKSAMAGLAPPAALSAILERTDTLSFDEVQFFDVVDFIDVNQQQEELFEVARGLFFADDGGDGYFFIDRPGFVGVGPGHVFWVSRSALAVDDCISVCPSFVDFLDVIEAGNAPWIDGRTLGDQAIEPLGRALRSAQVEARPPIDPMRFYEPSVALPIPMALGEIWKHADGFVLADSQRQFFGLDETTVVEGTETRFDQAGALWIGKGPDGLRYVTTVGDWRGLPPDRLIAVPLGQTAAEGEVLGRTADVLRAWIENEPS